MFMTILSKCFCFVFVIKIKKKKPSVKMLWVCNLVSNDQERSLWVLYVKHKSSSKSHSHIIFVILQYNKIISSYIRWCNLCVIFNYLRHTDLKYLIIDKACIEWNTNSIQSWCELRCTAISKLLIIIIIVATIIMLTNWFYLKTNLIF